MFVGRKFENSLIENLMKIKIDQSLLIGVKGVRRVGKTTFVNHFVQDLSLKQEVFFLSFTGLITETMQQNFENVRNVILTKIHEFDFLEEKDMKMINKKINHAKTWLSLFVALSDCFKLVYQKNPYLKIVVFFDEICWFSKKDGFISDFKAAWNAYFSQNNNLICFMAGSKISWMNEMLFKDTNEFYSRIDLEIELKPFTLKEIGLYLLYSSKKEITLEEIVNYYLMFGGIIKYYSYLDLSKNYEENIKNILTNEKIRHLLKKEKEVLFDSLFSEKRHHQKIMKIFASSKSLTVSKLVEKLKKEHDISAKIIKNNIYKDLDDLVENGILSIDDRLLNKNYSLNNNFVYFYFYWLDMLNNKSMIQQKKLKIRADDFSFNNASYDNWKGVAFEILIFNHIDEILEQKNVIKNLNVVLDNSQLDLVCINEEDKHFIVETKNYGKEWILSEADKKDLVKKIISYNQKRTKLKIIAMNGARFSKNLELEKMENVDFIHFLNWFEKNLYG